MRFIACVPKKASEAYPNEPSLYEEGDFDLVDICEIEATDEAQAWKILRHSEETGNYIGPFVYDSLYVGIYVEDDLSGSASGLPTYICEAGLEAIHTSEWVLIEKED